MVLIDSSVWVEFFGANPSPEIAYLDQLILEKKIATCLPIMAEVLSGAMSNRTRTIVQESFESMVFIDLDWKSKYVWEQLALLAEAAKKKKIGVPGIVDRMIILSAINANMGIWSFDKRLNQLARALEAQLYIH